MKTTQLFLICSLFSFNLFAQNLGINNLDPQAALDLKGDLRLRTATLNLPQGISHNVDLTTNKAVNYNFDGGSLNGAIISGFTGGVDGRIITIFNNGASAIQLYDEAAGSLAQNRIVTGSGNPAVIYQNGSVNMRYDGQKMRWALVSSNYTDGLNAPAALIYNIGNYGTVVNPITGKVWLDRNLGATQVATSPTDEASYGDLYQWGRGADGHQVRTSGVLETQATSFLSGGYTWSSLFIINGNWLSTGETQMWSGIGSENNPCPTGFRVPTNGELEQERLTWATNDASGAFASVLKLPLTGRRKGGTGEIMGVGEFGMLWSSTASAGTHSRFLLFGNISAMFSDFPRAWGMCIRCIKD